MDWQQLFQWLIGAVIGLAGAPITQLFKNLLGIEDRWAVILTGAVAAVLAIAEMFLTGQLVWGELDLAQFPVYFSAVFALASLYYGWMKNSPSKLGAGLLLKPADG